MTLKELATKTEALANQMQTMFDGMTEEQYAVCDNMSLATFQGELYSWAEEIRTAIRRGDAA